MFVLPNAPAGTVVYCPFDTYDSNGASVTISGLAVTDIEIYKNGSTTQRASDNGYALLDSDGIDFDGATGLHGFSIDLADNSDAGFFAAGSQYWIHVNAITVDSQTVRFTYYLRIVAAESVAGTPKADVSHNAGAAITASSGRQEVNLSHIAGSAVSTTTAQLGVNVVQMSGDATAADNLEAAADGAGYNLGGGAIVAASVTGAVGSVGADGISAASLAAGAGTEIADAVLSRSVAGVESSAAEHTLCTVILAMLESSVSGSTWTIKRTDGSTTHASKSVTTNASADPITGVS